MIVTLPLVIFAALLGLALGALLAWLVASSRARNEEYQQRAELAQLKEQVLRLPELKQELNEARGHKDRLDTEVGGLRQSLGSYESSKLAQQQQIARLDRELGDIKDRYDQAMAEQRILGQQLAETRMALEAERSQTAEKVALLENAKEQLSNQFKALANDILEEKTKRFTEQNRANLGQLLDPFKVQLQEFRGRVDAVYVQESKDRSALTEQVKQLMMLNQQLSEDADNLTKALKGSSKAQGNWGELILDRVLEAGGLRKGEEYSVQDSHAREDGSRGQPDVVINLPEQRHLVVDAKVSLTAYEEHVNAESDLLREAALARHIESMRSHIKGLSGKTYQDLYGLETLDFVIMFVPIEPAFMLAISRDPKLWQEAWQKNVLLVSPSTLLFVVRTVSHLWRQEKQNRSVLEIVSRGAQLYDKLCGFVNDLTSVGDKLTRARSCYEDAFRKLSGGTGNLIWQAEKLRDLGVKPSKTLPSQLVGLANGEPLLVEEALQIESDTGESQLSLAAAGDIEK